MLSLSLFSALAVACGGAAPEEPTTPLPTTAEAEDEDDDWGFDEPEPTAHEMPQQSAIETLGITGPDQPWDEMSDEEKEWYMVGKVHPVMREVFANFNERYAEFSCETCHGPDGKERGWEMPASHLSAVPAFDSADFEAMANSKTVTFMREKVVPHTATLLGEAPYDPATGKGFSCFDCHPKE